MFDFSLTNFMEYVKAKNPSCIMRYFEPEEARLCKSGVVTVDENEKILKMVEKPKESESHWCCPPFYAMEMPGRRYDIGNLESYHKGIK